MRGTVAITSPRELVHKGDIVVIPMRGEIGPSLFFFLRRGIKLAEAGQAGAVVLDMNTYGGRLDSAEEITSALNQLQIPTYTFINTNAGSAGALIALATKHIYMAPVSAIGAAAPVLSTGQDLPETEREKTVSYWSALVRNMASRNGHNPEIAEAFMNKEKEVKVGDRVVHAKGSLLSLNAQEASEIINGKPLLADGVVQSLDELTKKANLNGQRVQLEPSGFEQLAFWITALAPLLLLIAIVCAYLEFKIPGATLPGVISGICFVLSSSGTTSPASPAGKHRPFRARRCACPHRGSLLRSFHHHLRRRRCRSYSYLALLGNDRPLSRSTGRPFDARAARSDAEPLHRHRRFIYRHRVTRALPAAHELLPSLRSSRGKSLGPILHRPA